MFYSNGADELPDERLHLGVAADRGLRAGDLARAGAAARTSTWSRGCWWRCSTLLGVQWRLIDGGPPFLHPGRAAEVVVDAREAGCLGELHPPVAADFGLDELEHPPVVLELDLDVVLPVAERQERRYEDLISYPAVFQDIAVVVDEAGRGADRASTACARPAGPTCATCGCSTSTAESRWARAASPSRCGSSSARTSARSPTRRSPAIRERIKDADRARHGRVAA